MYHRQPALKGTHRLVFSETGVSGISDLVRGEARWDTFIKWRESPDLFVLYSSPELMHVVPKRWFSEPGAITDFQQLLEDLPIERLR
jgi:hypothetical protein